MKTRKRTKLYGLFAVTKDGGLMGFIERSFSMDWSPTHVRVWESDNAQAYLEELQKSKNTNFERFFLMTANSKNDIRIEMAGRKKEGSKFDWRNRPFWRKDEA